MKKWSIGILIILLTGMLAACGNSKQAEGKDKKILELATSADFPPFESHDKSGDIVGFDIDLASYIAKQLGYELKVKDMKFDGLIGALQANRVDMVMAGMSATEKRRNNVDFSKEYNRSGEMFIFKKGKQFRDLEGLKGKTIGVQLGTIQAEGADKLAEKYGFTVKKLDSANIIAEELASNRIDVGYLDKTVAKGFVKKQDLNGFDDPTTSSPGMGIAFPKGSGLTKKVDKVIEKMESNGELDKLKNKWLADYQE
ncbi:transporter substrate-binding domain-containing protein [Virgibacillus halophilus]|uniref:Transporter substrate-binding domain-containing protein n=1 Tax=Tigheibacillus halophilus TaxID=361280 RepID=A0ABU5C7K4_9BACI|nr:transporter substrate-binding domain-containing protein [Virgibacillus halophilus]